jgi:pentatricopeptide repeat protein
MIQLFVQTTPNREKALHYHGLLRAAHVPPSAHTYKLLLDLHATLPPFDIAAAEGVFAEIEADPAVSVQGSHFASLITGYGIYADNLDKALEMFERIHTRPDAGQILQDAVVWEAVLNVIAHRGTLQQLEAMRSRMETSGNGNGPVRPTAYVYNVLITGYARAGQIDTARNLFESMGDGITGVAAPNNHPVLHTSTGLPKPSTRTSMSDPSGPGAQGEVEQTVFREPSTYEAMLRAELSVGEVTRAQDVMHRMEQRGYPWAVVARVRAVLDEAVMAQISDTKPTA